MSSPPFSTTTPLASNADWPSPVVAINNGGINITGTIFSDQSGALVIQQSFDGTHFDVKNTVSYTGGTGAGFNQPILAPWVQLIYNNGSVSQTTFRLYADIRDEDGNFVGEQQPSSGGQFAVLQATSSGYIYVGRFDGASAWDACSFAAVSQNQSGKYAAFDVATATVAQENVTRVADGGPASF